MNFWDFRCYRLKVMEWSLDGRKTKHFCILQTKIYTFIKPMENINNVCLSPGLLFGVKHMEAFAHTNVQNEKNMKGKIWNA